LPHFENRFWTKMNAYFTTFTPLFVDYYRVLFFHN
jgi:G:T/U-mismatch repair DNA glycosylase